MYISLHWFDDQEQLLETKSKDVRDAIKTLRQRKRNAPALRDEMMADTIDINAQRWKVTTTQAKKIILKAEQSERMFAKMGKIMKPTTNSSLKSLMVPRPCIDPCEITALIQCLLNHVTLDYRVRCNSLSKL